MYTSLVLWFKSECHNTCDILVGLVSEYYYSYEIIEAGKFTLTDEG